MLFNVYVQITVTLQLEKAQHSTAKHILEIMLSISISKLVSLIKTKSRLFLA